MLVRYWLLGVLHHEQRGQIRIVGWKARSARFYSRADLCGKGFKSIIGFFQRYSKPAMRMKELEQLQGALAQLEQRQTKNANAKGGKRTAEKA